MKIMPRLTRKEQLKQGKIEVLKDQKGILKQRLSMAINKRKDATKDVTEAYIYGVSKERLGELSYRAKSWEEKSEKIQKKIDKIDKELKYIND